METAEGASRVGWRVIQRRDSGPVPRIGQRASVEIACVEQCGWGGDKRKWTF